MEEKKTINNESLNLPKGEIFILMRDKKGNIKEIYYENLIMNEFGRFLGLCCESPTQLSSGINWIALGTGDSAWVGTTPPPPSITETELNAEVTRKFRNSSGGFKYLNPSDTTTFMPVGQSSRIIQMAWLFDFGQANNYPFRELGMYANSNLLVSTPYYDTTSTPNISTVLVDSNKKGILVNKKHFPIFTKTADWQLEITYRITFGG